MDFVLLIPLDMTNLNGMLFNFTQNDEAERLQLLIKM